MQNKQELPPTRPSWIDTIIRFCLENKLVVVLMLMFIMGWGVMVSPFDWDLGGLPRDPVPVDAIPDIGENQQIVFTEWMGRSPQDVEDQITYPLTVSLLGIPGVKTVRSYSFFGFSTIYVVFKDDIDFYWSRSRVLEKLSSLPADTLPPGIQPALGPDATAIGQVFWYTLEGHDPAGNPVGGWDLHELRTIQDWYVRYGLLSVDGVSEVASIGGYVQEYQIDVDPDAMRAYGISLEQVFMAVKMSNVDVGARTIEVNRVEYIIRGLGFIKELKDIEQAVIKVNDNVPIYLKEVAKISRGPALRRGALDKEGAEVVGGVVVVRYGENPMATIMRLKEKIKEIAPGLGKKILPDGTVSQVTIVPFYDRSKLIHETLGTLNSALSEEILVTIIVVIFMVMHLRSSILISGLLPLAVLMCFIGMKLFHVEANIMALSGIAIAIGTMVDMGVILTENILKHLADAKPDDDRLEVIYTAASEMGGAVITAVSTTVVSFLPVFTMIAAEGKLFKPLAYTKSFALISSVIVALTIIPPVAHLLFINPSMKGNSWLKKLPGISFFERARASLTGINFQFSIFNFQFSIAKLLPMIINGTAIIIVAIVLTDHWMPLGPELGMFKNFIFVSGTIGGLLFFFLFFQIFYGPILQWCLIHKIKFLMVPMLLLMFGMSVWLGFNRTFGFIPGLLSKTGIDPAAVRSNVVWASLDNTFPGLGKEFMPPLDEGSYLFMPTTMPHASIGEALKVLSSQNMAIKAIPEVESVVGKLGRAETALDPAPISMIETVINYKPEYMVDKNGYRLSFRFDESLVSSPSPLAGDGKTGGFVRDENGELIPDSRGRPFRLWRAHIKKPDDIWKEIIKAAKVPGTTSAPKLQPIAARIVMLQSGMRAPMGVKIKGPDLETLDKVGLTIERFLKEIPSVEAAAVIADRIVGKPYLEIEINREAIARYGIKLRTVQDVIEVAIGGKRITTTVEGRERYPVRVRYMRELRDSIESLDKILVPAPGGAQIPMGQLTKINYVRGPQVIKSEDTFLVGYVLFDMKPGYAEVDVVEDCKEYLDKKIKSGEFDLPAGVSYTFAGSYENQVRSEKKLMVVLPVALFVIFMILYLQFRSVPTTMLVFSGILVAWAGGFIMIWLYSQGWFLDFTLFGQDMRDIFQVRGYNLSVAVWVGFIALFGIASDNGVVIATYLDQSFKERKPDSISDIREATMFASLRRIRPCLMTAGTTILALIPVLTSTGRGSDVMVPMAIPSFGGMMVVLITAFIVPVLYCAIAEVKFRFSRA